MAAPLTNVFFKLDAGLDVMLGLGGKGREVMGLEVMGLGLVVTGREVIGLGLEVGLGLIVILLLAVEWPTAKMTIKMETIFKCILSL